MNPQRILRQRLEDLQRAGVTDVPAELTALVDAISQYGGTEASRSDIGSQPRTGVGIASGQKTALPSPSSAKVTSSEKPAGSPAAATLSVSGDVPHSGVAGSGSPRQLLPSSTGALPAEFRADQVVVKRPCSTLSRDERSAGLSRLADQVATCTRCQELAETRTRTVFGVGNPEARIMYIGEAPGADEDRQGEPFVGRAGQLLDKITAACRLTREEIYICNILRCRPPGNRNPKPDEAANCREYLDAQIEFVDPEYIVCWGSVAAHNLLDTKAAIGKMRGRFFDYKGIKVLCTYHPSYLLRSPGAKKDVWADMKFFRADMGVKLD